MANLVDNHQIEASGGVSDQGGGQMNNLETDKIHEYGNRGERGFTTSNVSPCEQDPSFFHKMNRFNKNSILTGNNFELQRQNSKKCLSSINKNESIFQKFLYKIYEIIYKYALRLTCTLFTHAKKPTEREYD